MVEIDSFTGVRAKEIQLTCDLAKILKLLSAALFIIQPRSWQRERGAIAHRLQRDPCGAMSSLWVAQEGGCYKREGA